jgi:integrase
VTPELCLVQAAEVVLSQKVAKHLKPKSIENARGQFNALVKFFGDIPINEVHAGSLIAYQEWRLKTASAHQINHECALLKKILKRAVVVVDGVKSNLWEPLAELYNPVKPREWAPPKTFTVQEQQRIFDFAANDPNVELAQIVFTITRNTTASGLELRGLRLRNLELNARPPHVHVPPDSTKNDVRPRVIPLNDQAFDAFQRAVVRAAKLGSHRPDHFLFPFRVNRALWDPTKHASKCWLKRQGQRLRRATGIAHLKPHAFRHLAVTELLEAGVPEQTVIALAGWVGRKMLDTYSHTRIEAKYEAVRALDKVDPEPPALRRRSAKPARSGSGQKADAYRTTTITNLIAFPAQKSVQR